LKGIDTREILLALGAFLTGLTAAYSSDPTGANWLAWLMGGLSSLGTGIGAYAVTNPRLQPRTPEALLEAVKQTDLPPVAKEAAASALGSVATAEASAPAPKEGTPS